MVFLSFLLFDSVFLCVMASNELMRLMDKVKLNADEGKILEFGDDVEGNRPMANSQILVGRWLSKKSLNLKAMSQALMAAWNLRKAFQLRDLDDGRFVAEFLSRRDKEKVVADGPWHYERQLVVLKEPHDSDQLSTIALNKCNFWVRIMISPLIEDQKWRSG